MHKQAEQQRGHSRNSRSKKSDAIHVVDNKIKPEMGITTNIKVNVSNRLKSAHPGSQIAQQNQTAANNVIPHQEDETITPGNKSRSYKRLHSASRRRGMQNPYMQTTRAGDFVNNQWDQNQVHYGTLLQKRLDSRGGYCGSYHGALHQQRLYKGSNFSQLSKNNNLTQSIGFNKGFPMTPGGKSQNNSPQTRNRVLSASNYTAALSGPKHTHAGGASNNNASKPAIEYLNMTSIKSSTKTDRISNSISMEYLNAHKIRKSRNNQTS